VELERGLSGLSALSATAQIPVKQQKSAPQTSSQTATKGVGLADILPKQTRSGNEPQKSTEAAAAAVVNDRLCISPFPALASQKQEAKARELLQPSLFAQTLFAVGISQDCAGDPNEEYSKSAAVRLNQGPFHFSSLLHALVYLIANKL
jgi:hypothetical protein